MPPLDVLSRPRSAVGGLAAAVRGWPVASQRVARRNAMLAATECAERRAQREEVAAFLAERDAPLPVRRVRG